ncbi:MAG: hypothetical protein EXQ74_01165 [Thermoleophilia bacterium]|nr:hypothetical protein [Thermoleophilia bacterium]
MQLVSDRGFRRRFDSTVDTDYRLGDHLSWTMGAPVPETILIHRALEDAPEVEHDAAGAVPAPTADRDPPGA